MLLNRYWGVPLLLVPFCISSAPLEEPLSVPQQLQEGIKEALQSPLILNCLSPVYLSILRSFNDGSIFSSAFFEYICAQYEPFQDLTTDRDAPSFWSGLIESHFCDFANANPRRAQAIVNRIVLKTHPFSAELQGFFSAASFLQRPDQSLEGFFTDAINDILKQQLLELFTKAAPSPHTQQKFRRLLYKYKQSIPHLDLEHKYVHALLMNISFDCIHPFAQMVVDCEGDLCSCLKDVAATAYRRMENSRRDETDKVQSVFASLSPTVYATATDKRYEAVMREYVASGREPRNTEEFRLIMADTLQNTQLSSRLPPECLSIMRGIEENNRLCRPLFLYACAHFTPGEVLAYKNKDYFWVHVINRSFLEVVGNNQDQAREILEQIVVPKHPMLSHEAYTGKIIEEFFEQTGELTLFIEDKVRELVVRKMHEIMNSRDAKTARLEYIYLLHKYSMTVSWHDESFRYHFAFLMRLGPECFENEIHQFGTIRDCFSANPGELAWRVYETMRNGTLEQAFQAQAALNTLPPKNIYPLKYKGYSEAIKSYIQDKHVPADLQFVKDLMKSKLELREVQIKLKPVHLFIIEALSNEEDSKIYQDFLCFIFENYLIQNSRYYQYCNSFFWRSLILSSLYQFAQEHPEQAHPIIEQVHTLNNTPSEQLHQSLEEQCMVLTDGLLRGFPPGFYFFIDDTATYGHKTTLKYILDSDLSISSEDKKKYLDSVISSGNMETLKYLVKKREEGYDFEGDSTQISTVMDGQMGILKYLIEEGMVNANYQDGDLLCSVAIYGDIRMVRYLIEERGVSASSKENQALVLAAYNNHMHIVKYLMEDQKINAGTRCDLALFAAAGHGSLDIVKYLVEKHNANVRFRKGKVLLAAAEYGNTAVVKYLLSKGAKPNALSGKALAVATEKGFVDISKCLVLSGGKISADCIAAIKHKQEELLRYFALEHRDEESPLEKQELFFKREDILALIESQGAISG